MVVRGARPPTGEENHDSMLRSGGAYSRAGVDGGAQGAAPCWTGESRVTTVCCDLAVPPLGQVWMVVRRARPPMGEENHGGMLR